MVQKPGSVVHVEIHSGDPARTKQFFGDVFGWKFEDIPEMNYTLWRAPGEPHGGLQSPMAGQPPQVLNYILSKEIGTTAPMIERAGGTVVVPKTEIPGQGWFAVFREPGGTTFALYQTMPKPRAAAKPRRARKRGGAKKARKRRR